MARPERSTGKILGDLLDAASAAAEIVARGREEWERDRLLRLAGEAVISRMGDAAGKLPDDVRAAMPSVAWDEIRANRILVAHIYHRIDAAVLWATIAQDVPLLVNEVERWQHQDRAPERARRPERDDDFDLGF